MIIYIALSMIILLAELYIRRPSASLLRFSTNSAQTLHYLSLLMAEISSYFRA